MRNKLTKLLAKGVAFLGGFLIDSKG
jgi:hypothetical protein